VKERVDVLCVQQGLFDSREKAKRAIMAGLIHSDHERLDKPGMKIDADTELFIKGETLKYVSRGGLKLERAIETFNIDLKGCIMIDIGASTGGFTDCALQNGAVKVYAVDVGTNQLVWQLRNDDRVISMEKMNFRYATAKDFNNEPIDFVSIDVSFISLKHMFNALAGIVTEGTQIVALIKPQFEAGREDVGKNGIVRDSKVHLRVIQQVVQYAEANHFGLKGLTYSPITGGKGNIEFLGYFVSGQDSESIDYQAVVKTAHSTLKGGS